MTLVTAMRWMSRADGDDAEESTRTKHPNLHPVLSNSHGSFTSLPQPQRQKSPPPLPAGDARPSGPLVVGHPLTYHRSLVFPVSRAP
eukprot:2500842-Pyramimonas_sp.AAC.1